MGKTKCFWCRWRLDCAFGTKGGSPQNTEKQKFKFFTKKKQSTKKTYNEDYWMHVVWLPDYNHLTYMMVVMMVVVVYS